MIHRALCVLLALLLACSSPAHGRELKQAQPGCGPDLAALAAVPEVSDVVTLLKGFKLLPNGVPAGVTLFLPSNDAVDGLLQSLPVPGLTVRSLTGASLPPFITNRLVSALLYHVSPGTPELAPGADVPTALPGGDLKAAGAAALTDATGAKVGVVGGPLQACGSTAYIVDKVMLPAQLLSIPETTPEQAVGLLQAAAGGRAAAPGAERAP